MVQMNEDVFPSKQKEKLGVPMLNAKNDVYYSDQWFQLPSILSEFSFPAGLQFKLAFSQSYFSNIYSAK